MSYKHRALAISISLAILLSSGPGSGASSAKPAAHFRWLEENADRQLWLKIREAFAEELQADDAGVVGPQAAMGHKIIYRVGLEETSALILIAAQRDSTTQMQVRFLAYNYDTSSQRKQAIPDHTADGVWNLRIVKLAHFEPGPAADVVFQFSNCVRCEAQTLLASFRFDETTREWRWRNWEKGTSPHTGWTFLIGSNTERGFDPEAQSQEDYVYQTACVYRVADLNGDDLDDVASWCRETVTAVAPPRRVHSVTDTTLLFTAKGGNSKLLEIKDSAPAAALHRQICSTQPHTPPCHSVATEKVPTDLR